MECRNAAAQRSYCQLDISAGFYLAVGLQAVRGVFEAEEVVGRLGLAALGAALLHHCRREHRRPGRLSPPTHAGERQAGLNVAQH